MRMPRTTVNLDASVLRAVRSRAAAEGRSMGAVISELVALALGPGAHRRKSRPLQWRVREMKPRVDLEDKEAVRQALGNR